MLGAQLLPSEYIGCHPFVNATSLKIRTSGILQTFLPLPGAVGAAEPVFLVLYADIYSKSMLGSAMIFTRFFSYYLCFVLCGVVSIVNHIILMRKARCNRL